MCNFNKRNLALSVKNSFKFAFAAASVIYTLFFYSVSLHAVELQDDDMVSGEISFVGETDQYTFSANAGETIFLSVADTQITGGDSGFTPVSYTHLTLPTIYSV